MAIRNLFLGLALAAAPCAAAAAPLIPFSDGMDLTVRAGQQTTFSLIMDPCSGVGSGCYRFGYDGGGWVIQEEGMQWLYDPLDPGIFRASGAGWQCEGDQFCFEMFFEPIFSGVFNLDFAIGYETRTYLGGDDYGSEFVVTGRGYASHGFRLTVLPPVPLPPSGLALAGALGGLLLLFRRRAAEARAA